MLDNYIIILLSFCGSKNYNKNYLLTLTCEIKCSMHYYFIVLFLGSKSWDVYICRLVLVMDTIRTHIGQHSIMEQCHRSGVERMITATHQPWY